MGRVRSTLEKKKKDCFIVRTGIRNFTNVDKSFATLPENMSEKNAYQNAVPASEFREWHQRECVKATATRTPLTRANENLWWVNDKENFCVLFACRPRNFFLIHTNPYCKRKIQTIVCHKKQRKKHFKWLRKLQFS